MVRQLVLGDNVLDGLVVEDGTLDVLAHHHCLCLAVQFVGVENLGVEVIHHDFSLCLDSLRVAAASFFFRSPCEGILDFRTSARKKENATIMTVISISTARLANAPSAWKTSTSQASNYQQDSIPTPFPLSSRENARNVEKSTSTCHNNGINLPDNGTNVPYNQQKIALKSTKEASLV